MNRTRRSSNNYNVENIVRDINPGNDDDDDYDVDDGDAVADVNTASKEEIPESNTGGLELTQTKSSIFT